MKYLVTTPGLPAAIQAGKNPALHRFQSAWLDSIRINLKPLRPLPLALHAQAVAALSVARLPALNTQTPRSTRQLSAQPRITKAVTPPIRQQTERDQCSARD